jgi:DNA (cytosine-5)-methyltransferase 1
METPAFFKVCVYLKPTYIIFENVAAFATESNGANLQQVLSLLVENNYQVRFGVLRAAAHGVPQARQRYMASQL